MDQPKKEKVVREFTGDHHKMYEKLRAVMMSMHHAGVPGIDEVLTHLQKVHMKHMGNDAQGGAASKSATSIPEALKQLHEAQSTRTVPPAPFMGGGNS